MSPWESLRAGSSSRRSGEGEKKSVFSKTKATGSRKQVGASCYTCSVQNAVCPPWAGRLQIYPVGRGGAG